MKALPFLFWCTSFSIPASFARVGEVRIGGSLIQYPLKSRKGQELVTQHITLEELHSFALTYSNDSPPKQLTPFILTIFETDGLLPLVPSLQSVETALETFITAELNQMYSPNHRVRKTEASILSQKSTATTRRGRSLQTTGSELEVLMNVTFRSEPSPTIDEVDDKIKVVMANLLPFLQNLTAISAGDQELENVHSAFRLEIPSLRDTEDDDASTDDVPTTPIVSEQDPSTSREKDGNVFIIPLLFAACAATLFAGALFVRRKGLVTASSGSSEKAFSTSGIDVYWDEESDIFSFETTLLDSPHVEARRQQSLSQKSSNLFTGLSMKRQAVPLHKDGDILSNITGQERDEELEDLSPVHGPTSAAVEEKADLTVPDTNWEGDQNDMLGGFIAAISPSRKDSRSVFSFFTNRTGASHADTVQASNRKGDRITKSTNCNFSHTPKSNASSIFSFLLEDDEVLSNESETIHVLKGDDYELQTKPASITNYQNKKEDTAAVAMDQKLTILSISPASRRQTLSPAPSDEATPISLAQNPFATDSGENISFQRETIGDETQIDSSRPNSMPTSSVHVTNAKVSLTSPSEETPLGPFQAPHEDTKSIQKILPIVQPSFAKVQPALKAGSIEASDPACLTSPACMDQDQTKCFEVQVSNSDSPVQKTSPFKNIRKSVSPVTNLLRSAVGRRQEADEENEEEGLDYCKGSVTTPEKQGLALVSTPDKSTLMSPISLSRLSLKKYKSPDAGYKSDPGPLKKKMETPRKGRLQLMWGKARRHAKSTAADGTTNYQAETMDPQDWSLDSEKDVVSYESNAENETDETPAQPASKTSKTWNTGASMKKEETISKANKPPAELIRRDVSPSNSIISALSGASYTGNEANQDTRKDTKSAKNVLGDLAWLEKKIAASANTVISSPGSDGELDLDNKKGHTNNSMDSLSFDSADDGNDGSLETSAEMGSPGRKAKGPQGLQTILCRDCYAPPGKLKIVIHSTKDGPAVHTVKEGSSLQGHIFPGDLIISVDNEDTRAYTAEQVMKMMTKRFKHERKITVLHFEEGEEL